MSEIVTQEMDDDVEDSNDEHLQLESETPPGRGMARDPFVLTLPEHMVWMSRYADLSRNLVFVLEDDIVVPQNLRLSGGALLRLQFNGNGHTLTLNSNRPLFSGIGADSVVQNIVIAGSISGSGNQTAALTWNNRGTLRNIELTASLNEVSRYTGALVGINHGTIRNVTVSSDITSTGSDEFFTWVGGIVFENHRLIENSSFTGSITGTELSAFGGIAGHNQPRGVIRHVTMSGDVTGSHIGGVAVFNHNRGEISHIQVSGNVSGSDASGIAFENFGVISSVEVSGSLSGNFASGVASGNNGEINGAKVSGVVHGFIRAGGVAQRNYVSGVIKNVHVSAYVTGGRHTGGIVYINSGGTVEYAIVSGLIRGTIWYSAGVVDINSAVTQGRVVHRPVVQNTVVISPFIHGRLGSARIFTYLNSGAFRNQNQGTLRNNHAYAAMRSCGYLVTNGTHNNYQGQNVDGETLATIEFWRDAVGFDFVNAWQWCDDANLPVLRFLQ